MQNIDWDLVILDEYHFGAWNQRTQGTLKVKEEKSEDLETEYQEQLKKQKILFKNLISNQRKRFACLVRLLKL